MRTDTYAFTNAGGRDNNEDAYEYSDRIGVWVVADGLGGHADGEIASKLAVEYVLNHASEPIANIIVGANAAVLSEHGTMRTTLVAAFLRESNIQYAHVGDSRFYYFKNGSVYVQSKDHSVSQMAVNLGEISREDIRFHEDRNKVLKVLGENEALKIGALEPSIATEPGDAFLLCTDGFWEFVFETEMEIDLAKSKTPREWVEFMCKRLLLRVSGSNDNFTAVACFIGE